MIIELLRTLQHNKYSLQTLSAKLNISTFEVLELIGFANATHKIITNNYNNEYYLLSDLDFLDKSIMDRELSALNYNTVLLDTTNSTNSYVLANLATYDDKTIVMTEFQSSGRGRLDKVWFSKIATDFTLSYYYRIKCTNINSLPLVVAISIVKLLQNNGLKPSIKWPNDVFCDNAKIAGILVESKGNKDISHVIIGIGLNNIVNLPRTELIINLTKILDADINQYIGNGFGDFVDMWNKNCLHNNSLVLLHSGSSKIQGISRGVDVSGNLMIQTNDGNITYHYDTSYSLTVGGNVATSN